MRCTIVLLQCTLLKKTGQVQSLLEAVRLGTDLHPQSVRVWLERLETSVSLGISVQEVTQAIDLCLKTVPVQVTNVSDVFCHLSLQFNFLLLVVL